MITASLAVVLAAVAVALIRRGSVRVLHAVMCALLGFEIASTSIAPGITAAISSLTGWVGSLHL